MERREFLKSSAAVSALSVLPAAAFAASDPVAFDPRPGAWRSFDVTTRVEIAQPQGVNQAWIPLPSFRARDWIRPGQSAWTTNGQAKEVRAGGASLLHVTWAAGMAPAVEVTSRVATRDRAIDLGKPGQAPALSDAERKRFTAATAYIPTDGIVRETALKAAAGAKTDLDKARAVYEWVVANTWRNPKTRGCGTGDVAFLLKSGDLGGKCADLNGLYVGMVRALGIPARDLYGIRVAPSSFGFKALGAGSEVITKAQHCRAEVWLEGYGWVPADPADVRKVVLEEPPGNLAIDDPKVAAAHKTLFGAWETNWIAYNDGHDVALPGAHEKPIAFLMYPQGMTGAGALDCLEADAFKYTITSKPVAA